MMPDQAPPKIKIQVPKNPTPTIVDLGIEEQLRKKSKALLILSGWPVIIYPFVFISMIMAMSEPRPPGMPWIPLIIGSCFRSVCLGYPCVFIPCAVGAITAARRKDRIKELKYAKTAFYYFLFVVGLGVLSGLVS